ncbi:hypothetical protein D5S17_01435 [Pseudonocardiaceae bacterium YIM PH 21723]|nr:hypothetical protein D5S17_01435 [Pseudonocardiaceae bacterium YIM PH 21723]
MKARTVAILLTAALAVYFVLLAERAIKLISLGGLVGIGLGIGVLLLPLLGAWIVYTTWQFGARTAELARRLADEGMTPDTDDLPRMPSGRVRRDAADAYFAERKAELEAHPDDWRHWFLLAHAYDIAGDRSRARETMRRAVDLSRSPAAR